MSSIQKTPGSVIGAGIVAIVGSCCGLLVAGASAATLAFLTPPGGQTLPDSVRAVAGIMMGFFAVLSVFGIFTGIGLIRLKNWARISALIWAGIGALFSAFALVFGMLMPLPAVPGGPAGLESGIRVFLVVFYSVPLGIGIWWLILLNRKNIAARFAGLPAASNAPEGETQPGVKPARPLVLMVVAVFLILSSFSVVALLFVRIPMLIFGHILHGPAGTGLLVLLFGISALSGIGLLKLRPWGHTLAIAYEVFLLLNGAATVLSSDFETAMQETISSMALRAPIPADFVHNMRPFASGGLFFPVVILALLFYYRARFLEAAIHD